MLQLSYQRFFFREKQSIEDEMLNVVYKIGEQRHKSILSDEEIMAPYNARKMHEFLELLQP